MELQNGSFPRNELPFQLPESIWGDIKHFEEEGPGVFYISAHDLERGTGRELYAVTPEAVPLTIPEEALTYGKIADNGVYIFEYEVEGNGWEIIQYEILKYKVKSGIQIDGGDSPFNSAIYAADRYPGYFGGPLPPRCTPWGLTTRCKKAAEGIFFLETDRAVWALALAYPIWTIELSDACKNLGRSCDLDRQMGEEGAQYLYFKRESCAPPIFELLDNSDYGGLLTFIHSREALETHLIQHFPEYSVWHNSLQVSGLGTCDFLENLMATLGCELDELDLQSEEKQERRINKCIHFYPRLADTDYLLLH